MRLRVMAAVCAATALIGTGAMAARAAPQEDTTVPASAAPPSSPAPTAATAATAVDLVQTSVAEPSTSVPTTTVTTTTVPPTTTTTTTTTLPPTSPPSDDDSVDDAPGAAIDGGASAAAPAGRTGTSVQVGDTQPPPPPDEVLPESSGSGRRVVYSNSRMRVWAVEEDGTVVKTHKVSGRYGLPSPGTYHVWSRSLYTYSAANPNVRWMYMVRFAWTPSGGNIGFHEIPTKCDSNGCAKMQTEAQLGQSLSGGCVRQSTPDAIWMWEWAQLGTTVVVLA